MTLLRLQKILSSAGICSRRKAESYILNGFVKVNGVVVNVLGAKADPEVDEICVNDSLLVRCNELVYVILNKPKGYVSSCCQVNARVVTELIDLPTRLFPIGRLDKNSTGLLLLTNDGRIHHRLSHPSFRHEKEYYVEVLNSISDKFIDNMRKGVKLNTRLTSPAQVVKLSKRSFKITLIEGRNRQIRRMVKYLRNRVLVLKRIRVVNIKLGSLSEGEWRYLSQKEEKTLMISLKLF